MALDRDTSFTWHGHACVEIRTPGGRSIIVDPWFGNPSSIVPHTSVERCDVLLVTHGHGDHFGEALQLASRFRPFWPAMHEIKLWAGHRVSGGLDSIIGMNKGGTVEHEGIKITMVRADHSSGEWSPTLEAPLYFGEPVGFVVEVENGFRFYHAGDTDVFSDMRLIGELHRPEVALLPIGGHYTMGPSGAALACELLGVRHVIPIHWGTYPALAGTPAELREELAKRNLDVTVHELRPGETLQ